MSDVYRKDGKPDRVVNTEAERTSAKFEGFRLVKDAPKAEKAAELSNTGGGSQSADAKNAELKAAADKAATDAKTEAPKPGPKTN